MAPALVKLERVRRHVPSGQSFLLAACLAASTVLSAKGQDAYVCKLFAREYVTAVYIHNLKTPSAQSANPEQKAIPDTSDSSKVPFLYQKLLATCLASDKVPDLPDVPEATDKVWLEDLTGGHIAKAAEPAEAAREQTQTSEKTVSIMSSEQSKAEATCGRVNMRVSWMNNGRSWRCVR
jgi:hypothetical protein